MNNNNNKKQQTKQQIQEKGLGNDVFNGASTHISSFNLYYTTTRELVKMYTQYKYSNL